MATKVKLAIVLATTIAHRRVLYDRPGGGSSRGGGAFSNEGSVITCPEFAATGSDVGFESCNGPNVALAEW